MFLERLLDLDAHPPDGTAACLRHDRSAWVGSDQAFYRAIGFEVAHRYSVYEYRAAS